MIIDILTIFPGMVAGPIAESIIGKAIDRKLIDIRVTNIRDYAVGPHRTTDDRPFGGGSGMVIKPDPLGAALGIVRQHDSTARVILLSPQGRLFDQGVAFELSRLNHICLVCGRYEGVDERIRNHYVDDEISIGDYILTGGELPAMVIVDAVARLLPGVLGSNESLSEESFITGLLEYPHYTRPEIFGDHRVPDILLSGNHGSIRRWRRQQALIRTWQRRPDLLEKNQLSREDEELLAEAIGKEGD
jgi:tRNA (guanine37-N1)-methyltransferase